MTSTLLPLACAVATALLAGTMDYFTGRMPNWITLPSLLLSLIFWSFVLGTRGFTHSIAGAFLVGSGPLVLFLFSRGEAIGGGDVKALGALGGWLGAGLGLEVALVSFCLLGLYAIVLEAIRGDLVALLQRTWKVTKLATAFRRHDVTDNAADRRLLTLRFGPALCLGTTFCCGAELWERLRWVHLL